MSVDTYLKGKNLTRYHRVRHDGLEVLVTPFLVSAARTIVLDYRRGFLWRSLQVEVEPRDDHFHSSSCRH